MFYYLFVASLISLSYSSNEDKFTCLRADDDISSPPQPNSKGIPGRRGPPGPKGERGSGKKGEPGIPDNSLINSVRRKLKLLFEVLRLIFQDDKRFLE